MMAKPRELDYTSGVGVTELIMSVMVFAANALLIVRVWIIVDVGRMVEIEVMFFEVIDE